jgi:hypothetical protein
MYQKNLTEELIIKYLIYLQDMSESALASHYISRQNLVSISKEFYAFQNSINNQSNILKSFKDKISSIIFNYEDESKESSIKIFLRKFIYYWILRRISSEDGDAKSTDIDNLRNFNNQISHLVFNINNIKIFI